MHRLATALLIALAVAAPVGAAPDLILINGKVFTSDAGRPAAEAFAVTEGRFTAVGPTAAVRRLAAPSTRIVDAGGRLVIPGLIDAHVHVDPPPPGRPIVFPGPPFPKSETEATLGGVAAAAQSGPGWLSGDISVAVFNDPRAGRTALDRVAPSNPVILTATLGPRDIAQFRSSRGARHQRPDRRPTWRPLGTRCGGTPDRPSLRERGHACGSSCSRDGSQRRARGDKHAPHGRRIRSMGGDLRRSDGARGDSRGSARGPGAGPRSDSLDRLCLGTAANRH